MNTSYFFTNIEKDALNADFIDMVVEWSEQTKNQIYLIDKPLGENKYLYSYNALVLVIPKYKIIFIDFGDNKNDYEEYKEDFIEDLSAISDKYNYKDILGRPRSWKDKLIGEYSLSKNNTFANEIKKYSLTNLEEIKKCDLLISLLTGSINDVERVKKNVPENTLDKIKQKIILFDGDQTRFIFEKSTTKTTTIQGLSGTGKTELLLHKIKEIYIKQKSAKIILTCHNKILADSLRKRIPDFFNFMKVDQQIAWNERLMCVHAWGGKFDHLSGAYRYICFYYKIPFNTFSYDAPFYVVCERACTEIKRIKELSGDKFNFAFDYMFVDESQDFPKEFFELCDLVTSEHVYIAGDIFQSIFEQNIQHSIKPDYLLSKCYRTDPRTLMFGHAIGMGLFEDKPLRWLEESDWKSCGYDVRKEGKKILLKREPLRRFEDLASSKYPSIRVFFSDNQIELNIEDSVINLLKQIINENPTASPDDFAIILLDSSSEIYRIADVLWIKIKQELNWSINKGYESKKKIKNSIFISNRNNVKGLEFPFVICITRSLINTYMYRNSLYTMITRSFLQSNLIIYGRINEEIKSNILKGLNNILENGYIETKELSDEEKPPIHTKIEQSGSQMTLFDMFEKICYDNGIGDQYIERLRESYKKLEKPEYDEAFLEKWITTNYKMLTEEP
jgi:superfamily I DNA and RNA helicase